MWALAHTTHWTRTLSPRVLGETSRAPGRPSIAWRNAVSAPEGTSLLLQRHSICMGKGCPFPRAPAPGVGGPSTSLQDLQRLGPALAAPRHSSHPAQSCRSQGWMRKALSNAASPGHAFRFVTLWKFNPSPVSHALSECNSPFEILGLCTAAWSVLWVQKCQLPAQCFGQSKGTRRLRPQCPGLSLRSSRVSPHVFPPV